MERTVWTSVNLEPGTCGTHIPSLGLHLETATLTEPCVASLLTDALVDFAHSIGDLAFEKKTRMRTKAQAWSQG